MSKTARRINTVDSLRHKTNHGAFANTGEDKNVFDKMSCLMRVKFVEIS